ncbi:MAG: exosortase family protein XrtF [Chitinophagaceae bacterium]|nr:MAG: exosortase family protein XrtF [Chitinophagaceae bacterium]
MFSDFRPVFKILLRFLVLYVLLVLGYQLYLNLYKGAGLDPASEWVARQTIFVQNLLDYPSQLVPGKPAQETSWFWVSGRYVSRMVEGCNAVSVMILFVAFVIAFRGKWLTTAVFIFLGIIVIHILNIARIALLAIALLRFPESEEILHGVIFPAVIYGVVLLLWILWVNKFSLHAKKQ